MRNAFYASCSFTPVRTAQPGGQRRKGNKAAKNIILNFEF